MVRASHNMRTCRCSWGKLMGSVADNRNAHLPGLVSTDENTDSFPPSDAAYILRSGHQPGRNNNSYIFAHAELSHPFDHAIAYLCRRQASVCQ